MIQALNLAALKLFQYLAVNISKYCIFIKYKYGIFHQMMNSKKYGHFKGSFIEKDIKSKFCVQFVRQFSFKLKLWVWQSLESVTGSEIQGCERLRDTGTHGCERLRDTGTCSGTQGCEMLRYTVTCSGTPGCERLRDTGMWKAQGYRDMFRDTGM